MKKLLITSIVIACPLSSSFANPSIYEEVARAIKTHLPKTIDGKSPNYSNLPCRVTVTESKNKTVVTIKVLDRSAGAIDPETSSFVAEPSRLDDLEQFGLLTFNDSQNHLEVNSGDLVSVQEIKVRKNRLLEIKEDGTVSIGRLASIYTSIGFWAKEQPLECVPQP